MKTNKLEAAYTLERLRQGTARHELELAQLPRTPGRDQVQRGLDQVREGLATIKKEAEL